MKKSTLMLTLIALSFFACKNKDDDQSTPIQVAATDYFPLTVGSYWVYQWYNIDTLENETIWNIKDSVYVSADTIINGLTYAVLKGTELNGEINYFYRDSSGYMIDEKGGIPRFTINGGIEFLGVDTFAVNNSPWFWQEYKMVPNTPEVVVPAGTFTNCITTETRLTSLDTSYEHGVRIFPFYYAKNIGLVRHRTTFYSSPNYLESRLIKFHIE